MRRSLAEPGLAVRRQSSLVSGLAVAVVSMIIGLFPQLASAAGDSSQGHSDGARSMNQMNQVRLLWTNDTHGYFMPTYHAEANEADVYTQRAATEGKIGGYAYIEALVKKLKPQRTNALFMDAGDTIDGSPVAQMTRGEAVIPVLNAMGYDAWTPGNRDFAYGKAQFLKLASMLHIPTVSSTLRYADTGKLVFPPYLIKQLPTMKVAIIGLTHALVTNGFVLGKQHAPFGSAAAFQVADEISALVAKIRAKEHPDLVVALSHFGYPQDLKFASQQTGVDVILGAHTHHNVFKPTLVKDKTGHQVVVVQAGSHGKFLGDLDVTVRNHEVVKYHYRLFRVIDKHITPDPEILALTKQAYAPFQDYLDRVIGKTSTMLMRRGETQSSMENLITDGWAAMYGADVSRHFGIRYGATVLPGDITVGDVWNMVSPNLGNNGMYVGTISGAAVMGNVNRGLNAEYGPDPFKWPGGDVTRFNHNVKYTYKVNAPENQHIVNLKVGSDYLVKDGSPVPANLQKNYTYAASFPAGPSTPPVPGTTAVDEIVAYIQANQTVSPTVDDRAVRVDACQHGCQGGPNAASITDVGVASTCYSWATPGCNENRWVTGWVNGPKRSE